MLYVVHRIFDHDGSRTETSGPYASDEALIDAAVEIWRHQRTRLGAVWGERAFERDADGVETERTDLIAVIGRRVHAIADAARSEQAWAAFTQREGQQFASTAVWS